MDTKLTLPEDKDVDLYAINCSKEDLINYINKDNVNKVLDTLMIYNDVNKFTYILSNYRPLLFIGELLRKTIKHDYYIFYKIIVQNYISSNDTYNHYTNVGRSHNIHYLRLFRKIAPNDVWIQTIETFMFYEYQNHIKTSDDIIISCLADLDTDNITNISQKGLTFASLPVVKYLETKHRFTRNDWNNLIIGNVYQEVKHYAILKLNGKMSKMNILVHSIHLMIFLFNCIHTPYLIYIPSDRLIMSIREYVEYSPQLRFVFRENKKHKYIFTYVFDNLMYHVKNYDCNITGIIWQYINDEKYHNFEFIEQQTKKT